MIYRSLYTDAKTGEKKKGGDKLKFPKLAESLRRIAEEGADTYYNGSLMKDIIADLKDIGRS